MRFKCFGYVLMDEKGLNLIIDDHIDAYYAKKRACLRRRKVKE